MMGFKINFIILTSRLKLLTDIPMKKFVLLLAVAALFASCTEKGSTETKKPLTPEDQKVKMEEVAQEFMDKYPADTFEDFFGLSKRFAEKYFDYDYDWDGFFMYCEEKGEDMYSYFEDVDYVDGKYCYETTTDIVVMLSNLNGKVVLGENSVSCSDNKGLSVEFSLDGKDYVAELSFSGKKTVVNYSFFEVYDGYYDYYEDTYNVEVEIPETISLKVTENGKTYAEITWTFSFSISDEGVNLNKDSMHVSTSIKIDDNEMTIKKTGYDSAKNKAMAGVSLKKGSETVLDAEFSADVDVNLVEEDDVISLEVKMTKNADFYIDILGEMQIKGKCSDMIALAGYVENFLEAEDEAAIKRILDDINGAIDLGLYYNGSSKKTADVVMDFYVYYDEYWDEEFMEIEPILVFDDGSRYSFYEYFDEESFAGVIDSFELWIEMYETMLEHYFDY